MKKKALFLDRDGVINIEKHYLYKIKDFVFSNGIFDLCYLFQKNEYLLIVITNQSGVARGFYTLNQLKKVNKWMISEFKKNKIYINDIFFCPHHPDFTGECNCRKPKTGMINKAQSIYNIDLSKSILIGDKKRDIDAGKKAGIGKNFLIKSNSLKSNSQLTNYISQLS